MNLQTCLEKVVFCQDEKLVDRFEDYLAKTRKDILNPRVRKVKEKFEHAEVNQKAMSNLASYIVFGIEMLKEKEYGEESLKKMKRKLSSIVCTYVANPNEESLNIAGDFTRTFYELAIGRYDERSASSNRSFDYKKPMFIGVF